MNKWKIDWEEQWSIHGRGFRDGYLHVDLHDYVSVKLPNSVLKLKPGPGFGDLSHPTTRLVLKLMGPYIKGNDVIDLGCGSGILSLAAAAMGAKSVHGIDIDEEALEHSRLNSRWNGMDKITQFTTANEYCQHSHPSKSILLMNMIQSEQQNAWQSIASRQSQITIAVTSGVLVEGRQAYLEMCHRWGWQLREQCQEEGWLAFAFSTSSSA